MIIFFWTFLKFSITLFNREIIEVKDMTEEEKKNRKKKIRNLMRRLEVTKEEAEKYLDELADGLSAFIKETKANIKVIGLDEFGTEKK
jgi:hypothetical protein